MPADYHFRYPLLIGERERLVLAIGIWAGLRPSEIAALRYDDIDLDRGTILVRRGHVYGKTKQSTKTGKERLVYYLSPLAGRLRLWISEHQGTSINGWLFENQDGNPIHLNSISRRIIAPVAKKYGTLDWEDNAYYGARRGFGTFLVLSEASCEEVAKQMGNTRDVVWKYYFKDRNNELAQSAAAKYEARKRRATSSVVAGQLLGATGDVKQ